MFSNEDGLSVLSNLLGRPPKAFGVSPRLKRTQGAYLELLLLMNEGSERGFLIFNDQVLTRTEIAGLVGGDLDVSLRAIEELLRLGLVGVRKDDALFSPELVAQEKDRQENAIRQKAHRERKKQSNTKVTSGVTPLSQSINGQITDKSCLSSSSSSSSNKQRLGERLQDLFPVLATNRPQLEKVFHSLEVRAWTADLLDGWLAWFRRDRARLQMNHFNLLSTLNDYDEYRAKSQPRQKREYCGNCNYGWLPPAEGEDRVRPCPCSEVSH